MARLGRAFPAQPFVARVPRATPLAGLDLDSATYEFGQRTGLAVADFALFDSADVTVNVFADNVTMGAPIFSYTETTAANGRLARKEHASLSAGTFYMLACWTADGTKLGGVFRIQAT